MRTHRYALALTGFALLGIGTASGQVTPPATGEAPPPAAPAPPPPVPTPTKPVPADGRCVKCGNVHFTRRADDNAESMRTRLLAYYKETSTLVGYYWVKRLLRTVDGFREIDEVAEDISRWLDAQALERA